MFLYLMRHGEAEASLEKDPPLSQRGRRQVEAQAARFLELNIKFSGIFHSTRKRAGETAQIIQQAVHHKMSCECVERMGLEPNDNVIAFVADVLQITCQLKNYLFVGHLPFMVDLISYLLIGNSEKNFVVMSTAAVACLEVSEVGNGYLHWLLPSPA